MAGLALGIVLIILITGQPEPTRNPTQPQPALSPESGAAARLPGTSSRDGGAAGAGGRAGAAGRCRGPASRNQPAPHQRIRSRSIAGVARTRACSLATSSSADGPNCERPEAGHVVGPASGETPRDNSTPSGDEIAEAVLRATGGASAGSMSCRLCVSRRMGKRRSSLPLLRLATDANAHQSERTL